MSVSDEQIRHALAAVRSIYGITIVSFVAIGIQAFICFYGLSLFLDTPKNLRKGRAPYIAISWAIFTMFSLAQTGDAYQVFGSFYGAAANDPLDVLMKRSETDYTRWRLATSTFIDLVNWITDGLLVYRCWIIWSENRWVCIYPILAYLASIGMSIVMMVGLSSPTSRVTPFVGTAVSAWVYLSVAVNVLATSLIAFRLLSLRRELIQVLPARDMGAYLGVVAILVESALPLTLSGIAFASVVEPKTPEARIPNALFLCLWYSLNAICPQLIIFRVTVGRSYLRHPEIHTPTDDGEERVSANIAFTHASQIQTIDNVVSTKTIEEKDLQA